MRKLLATQTGQFGTITDPFSRVAPGSNLEGSENGSGLVLLGTSVIRLIIVVAGLYTLLNLILAGISFIGAGGDPKNIQKAWEKIWQSILGLLVVAGAFVIAVIIGYVIFGPQNALLLISPTIYAP